MIKLWQVATGEQEMFIEAPNMDVVLSVARRALELLDGLDHSDEEFDAVVKVHDGPVIREEDLGPVIREEDLAGGR
jgi:hypothetical protein